MDKPFVLDELLEELEAAGVTSCDVAEQGLFGLVEDRCAIVITPDQVDLAVLALFDGGGTPDWSTSWAVPRDQLASEIYRLSTV